jgi:hypothetical protein
MMLKWILSFVTINVIYAVQVKIVAPYEAGPEPCALLCAGTTGIGTTPWQNHGDHITVSVDISDCGFVSIPILSTVLTGDGYARSVTGSGSIYHLTTKKFMLAPTRTYNYDMYKIAKEMKWRVDWQAVGYVC